jgi:hypothetical protein
MEDKKFLPIGSIVILKNATKKIMISGYCSMTPEHKGELFDYTGCLYPEGLLSSDQVCLFNNDQIDKVFYEGYTDDESKEFHKKLIENYPKIVELAKSEK